MWTRRWCRKKGGSHLKKQYKVGIYCRLSVDDASNSAKAKNYIPGDESASIENQHEILSKFVMLNGWIEVKTYRDDGYSGGNFQRPGFLEMLEDARHGLINLILVKDLSRLGRDFVEVGRYTDVIFPSLGCRFVSVLDCLDSEGDNTDILKKKRLLPIAVMLAAFVATRFFAVNIILIILVCGVIGALEMSAFCPGR